MARQKLNTDLNELFPGEPLTIGTATVIIPPLGLEALFNSIKKIEGIATQLSEAEITFDNFNEPAKALKLVRIILETCPELLEEASNIDIEDIKQLPLEGVLAIINKVIEVNIKSKDALEGNFKSLIESFAGLTAMIPDAETKTKKQK